MLQGNFYSYNFTYVDIKLAKCVNSTKSPIICQDPATIDKFFDSLQFSVAFVNTYFDFNDYQ